MMSRLHRFAAVLSGILLLQLTLLGSGTLCGMRAGDRAVGGQMVAMANGAMPTHAQHDAPAKGCDAAPTSHDCTSPAAPGTCAGMVSCATVAAPQVQLVAIATPRLTTIALPEPANVVSGPALAPELPPPRA